MFLSKAMTKLLPKPSYLPGDMVLLVAWGIMFDSWQEGRGPNTGSCEPYDRLCLVLATRQDESNNVGDGFNTWVYVHVMDNHDPDTRALSSHWRGWVMSTQVDKLRQTQTFASCNLHHAKHLDHV